MIYQKEYEKDFLFIDFDTMMIQDPKQTVSYFIRIYF